MHQSENNGSAPTANVASNGDEQRRETFLQYPAVTTLRPSYYTSGQIAITNLSASIAGLEVLRHEGGTSEQLFTLSTLLFLRGDLLGRIVDHDRAEEAALRAAALSPTPGRALFITAVVAERFHRFDQAERLLKHALEAGYPAIEIDTEKASVLQATGHYNEALRIRERLADENPGIHSFGALATLLAEMDEWSAAEDVYMAALDEDIGVSPIPCGQLFFEWGVSAMRGGDLDRAEQLLGQLEVILPAHVPGRAHRAEIALARGHLDRALALIRPILEIADDPEYPATHAEILLARGETEAAASEATRAAVGYERLLARRPEAYADHGAAFFMGIGNRPQFAYELALDNWKIRDTPRSRDLLKRTYDALQSFLPQGDA